ncbi:hypothetical protein LOD99_4499 [Oopsacas minuta]|uniref:Uncharacterized protein n=1 Tax=Oopsacas minuta TaxID=111878 RepID=A0AAV7JTZ6_9METZ|nr:hypothetical protein LOD99_4499 [Oopsacas minuta]
MFSKHLTYEVKRKQTDDLRIYSDKEYSFGRDEKHRCWFGRKLFAKDTLSAPTGLTIQSNNRDILYVCDPYRIQVFNINGDFITSITPELIISPWAIIVENDAILITDIQLCALLVVTEYNVIKIGGAGVGQLDFISPRGMDCDSQGNIYIADAAAKRIRVFTSELAFLSTIGKGKLDNPIDVKVIKSSLVILLKYTKSVLVYSLSGSRQREIKITPKPAEIFSFITYISSSTFLLTTHSGPEHYIISLNLNGNICKIPSPLFSHGILYLPNQQMLIVASHNGDKKINILKYPFRRNCNANM